MEQENRKVGVWMPMVVDLFMPTTGQQLLKIIEAAGTGYHYPGGQKLSGMALYRSGDAEGARRVGSELLQMYGQCSSVVTCSIAEAAYLRHDFSTLFADTPQQLSAHQFSQHCLDISEWITQHQVSLQPKPYPYRTVYVSYARQQDYQRGGISSNCQQLLHTVPELELLDFDYDDNCLGIDPLFTECYAPLAVDMLRLLVSQVLHIGAQSVVSSEPALVLILRRYVEKVGLRLQCHHLIDVIG